MRWFKEFRLTQWELHTVYWSLAVYTKHGNYSLILNDDTYKRVKNDYLFTTLKDERQNEEASMAD